MSHLLWKYFLEDDIDRFRHVLARAEYNASAYSKNRTLSSGLSTSPGAPLSTSPTVTRSRKQQEKARGIQNKGTTQLSKADVNWKDAQGLTLLHHVASATRSSAADFAEALLQLSLLDLYIQDEENGWTALHRALYFGNVAIARQLMARDVQLASDFTTTASSHAAGGLIKIKDKEGLSPFELYHATIEDRGRRAAHILEHGSVSSEEANGADYDTDDEDPQPKTKPRVDINGDEVFVFGSNRNLTLGLGDEDDRQFPERVQLQRPDDILYGLVEHSQLEVRDNKSKPFGIFELPTMTRYKPVVIQNVQMTKLSTAILTSDNESNLYMCGFGTGGRLGTGDETTRFSFTNIRGGGLDSRQVHAIALGQNHTIAVTSDGETFVWGSNAYGQLGFAPSASEPKEEEVAQLHPRQLYGQLKREQVVGAAASRIHSAVFTASALYTFGKNEGQMGLIDSDARSLAVQSTPRRVGASLFTSPIKSVSATDRATVCLLEDHEIVVFANYGYTRNVLSPASLAASLTNNLGHRADRFGHARVARRIDRIMKISSGGDTICGLTAMGDLFTIRVSQQVETATTSTSSTTNPAKIREGLSQPQLIWSSRRANMAVVDVDVSEDGSVIICTKSGSVWRRVKRAKIKDATAGSSYKSKDYKFQRVPNLTNVVAVRSNTFGAYAAVRRDAKLELEQSGDRLIEDISSMYPFIGYGAEDSDTENPVPRFWSPHEPDGFKTLRIDVLDFTGIEEKLGQFLQNSANESYDMKVGTTTSNVRIPIHSFLLAGRSAVMDKAMSTFRDEYFSSVLDLVNLEYDNEGNALALFQGIHIITLLDLVLFLYTEDVINAWQCTLLPPEITARHRQIRNELVKVAQKLEMRRLEQTVRTFTFYEHAIKDDLYQAIQRPSFFSNGDVEIQIEGASQLVHGALVCARCPFFEGLFQGRASGRWIASRREDGDTGIGEPVKVDLSHVTPQVFSFVLGHLYASYGEDPFEEVVTADLDAFLDLVIDVLSVANELMLDGLAETCQALLSRYGWSSLPGMMMDTDNGSSEYEECLPAAKCCGPMLRDRLQEGRSRLYQCRLGSNARESVRDSPPHVMAVLMYIRLLGELDDDLMPELDDAVRAIQSSSLPDFTNWRAGNDLHRRHPELASRLEQSQRISVDRAYLQSKLRERESRMPVTRKASGELLEEYGQPSNNRKSPKLSGRRGSEARSPAFGPRSASHELMFDMEETSELQPDRVRKTKGHVQPPTNSLPPLELPEAAETHEALGASATSPSLRDVSFSNPVVAVSTQAEDRIAVPWANTPVTTSRLDMKEIMAQASSHQSSNLSIAMREKPSASRQPAAAKMSQKERKKMLQQHQLQAASPTPDPPAPISQPQDKPAPWQRSASGPQVSLKEVIAAQTSSPSPSPKPKPSTPSTPSMTMRQTISGKPPAAQRSVSTPSHQTKPTAPNNRSAPSPSQPQTSKTPPHPPLSPPRSLSTYTPVIRSVRHNTTPTPTSPSDPLPPQLSSMSDILAQQQNEKDVIRDAVAKRSLQEIQEEQAFQEWWDQESRKVQLVQEEESRKGGRRDGKDGGGSGKGGKRGRARVRGPRGRGRGGGNAGGGAEGAGRVGGEGSSGKAKEKEKGVRGSASRGR